MNETLAAALGTSAPFRAGTADSRLGEAAPGQALGVGHCQQVTCGLVEDLLISRGIVHRDEVKVLVYFTSVRYPESDPAPERQIRSRVESVLAGAEPDERTAVLISLAQAGGLLSRLVDEVPKDRVKEISGGDTTSAAVKAADT